MSDLKAIRLPKAATTYNVSMDHIVQELKKNGFEVESNPNTKITTEMLIVLEKAFNKDKAIKAEAVNKHIEKPKKEVIELKDDVITKAPKKETEEKEVLIKTNILTPDETEETIKKTEVKQPEKEPVVIAPVETAPTVDEDKVTTAKVKIDGPKIVGKIDLDKQKKSVAKEDSTKEKAVKTTKKAPQEEKPVVEEPQKIEAPKQETKKEEVVAETEVKITPQAIVPPLADDHIKTKFETLEGPKILGKIELKPDRSELPKKKEEKSEKRVRNRIQVNKKEKVGGDQQKTTGTNDNKKPGGFYQQKDRPNFHKDNKGRFDKKAPVTEVKEITEKEIEDKIKATMAKIQAQTNKSDRSKIRKERREAIHEKLAAEKATQDNGKLKVTEFMTAAELGSLMNIPAVKVIQTCMQLGIMVSINQRLDAEVIELVAGENGFEVEFQSIEDQTAFKEEEPDSPEDLVTRAPIVTIMGHVDHGKTSLLDYIRKANVVAKEAGGITQHIGAYEVKTATGRKITFLDTPGHEAFTAMRARGAKVTDIAIIVIAADDAVMPQTKEAINHAQAAGVPMIFAFNKIDKDGANADKIREQLSTMNLLVEEWGGPYQSQEISAKKGLNIDLLLEKVILQADLLDLKANPKKAASGTIIEASLDKGRGFTTTLLVQSGRMERGDFIVCGPYFGRVKAMFDYKGDKVDKAGPSTPVQVLGLSGAPQSGELFKVFESESEAKELANKRAQLIRETDFRTKKRITLGEIGRRLALGNFKELNIIIKGDVDGSVEALADSLMKLSTEQIAVRVLHKGVGQISESDVNLAATADAIIIGFNVRPSGNAKALAESEAIEIKLYSIIYQAIADVKNAMEGLLEPTTEEKITAQVEVREVFNISKVGAIAGCFVKEGKVQRTSKLRVIRDGIVLHTGTIAALKRFKDDAKEVLSGQECGIQIKDYNNILAGDTLEVFEEIKVAVKL